MDNEPRSPTRATAHDELGSDAGSAMHTWLPVSQWVPAEHCLASEQSAAQYASVVDSVGDQHAKPSEHSAAPVQRSP